MCDEVGRRRNENTPRNISAVIVRAPGCRGMGPRRDLFLFGATLQRDQDRYDYATSNFAGAWLSTGIYTLHMII
jgi:hypothetical protein